MVDITNLTGLEKPLTKLVETVSEGLGVVGNDIFKFDAKKIKRIGEAEAEVEKRKIISNAEAKNEAQDILQRANNRFILEQYTKQTNLENIVFKSQGLLKGQSVDDNPVDKDWISRFLGIAQDVSREDMQNILARILADEVKQPTTYSLRTLETVKNLTSKDLVAFKKFVALSLSGSSFAIIKNMRRETLEKYDLAFNDYIELTDIGLFNPNLELTVHISPSEGSEVIDIDIAGTTIILDQHESKTGIDLGIVRFTEVGAQIGSILIDSSENSKKKVYLDDFKDLIKSKGFSIQE